jgi:hypothetical protein
MSVNIRDEMGASYCHLLFFGSVTTKKATVASCRHLLLFGFVAAKD